MRRGVTYGILAGALWGGVFLAPVMLSGFSPIEGSAGRFAAYGLVSLLVGLPKARSLIAKLRPGDLGLLIRLALAGNLMYYCFVSAGVSLVGIAASSLIIGTLPVTITLCGAKRGNAIEGEAIQGDALSLRRLALPLLTMLLGIICISLHVFISAASTVGHAVLSANIKAAAGIVCTMGALASWTWFAIANRRALRDRPQFSGNEWSVIWGVVTGVLSAAVWLVLLSVPGRWGFGTNIMRHSPSDWTRFWAVNVALAIGASWLGNALWNAASRRLSTTLLGQMVVFETLFALLYGFVYAVRWPTPLEGAAIVLLLTGVLWSMRLHANAPPTSRPRQRGA